MSRFFKASVVENLPLIKDHFRITLQPCEKTQSLKPGNFFMLSPDNAAFDPLLSRPFSVHNWIGNNVQFLYRIVGKGTTILSKKKSGDVLQLLGPLGNSFPALKKDKNAILIAGGLGIAPIFSLAKSLSNRRPLLFYGAKKRDEILCRNEIRSLEIHPIISTDDGSEGKAGTITDLLKNYLSRHQSLCHSYVIYACGPKLMLKKISEITDRYKLKSYAALEENMACGLGTCQGCVVNTVHGFKRVCKEGPVFPLEEIIWDQI